MAADASDLEIVITREFRAPRELVFRAFTETPHLEQWWGPRGFTTRVEANDPRPGGATRYVMVGPDGTEYPVEGVYREFAPPERFVTTDEFGDPSQSRGLSGIVLTALFDALPDGGTRLTLRISHPSVEAKQTHSDMGVVAGWQSSFDCLDEHLDVLRALETGRLVVSLPSETEFRLTRALDAPRDLVFEAMSKPEHLRQWWGPASLTHEVCEMDFCTGGQWRVTQRAPDGALHPFRGEYLKIDPPRRIVQTFVYDVDFARDSPATETLTLEEFQGRTIARVVVKHLSTQARDGHVGSGMEGGANETYDRLEAYVRSLTKVEAHDATMVVTRVFDAPREAVWQAWADPEQIVQWWGPSGFTTTTRSRSLTPGGEWRYTMHGPDGTDYENLITYSAVEPPKRLAYKLGGEVDNASVNFSVEVTFEPWGSAGEKTRVTMRALFASAKAREHVTREFGAVEGAKQNFASLAAHLARGRSATGQTFLAQRVVRAAPEVVWDAFTTADALAQWFCPAGVGLEILTVDARPGGVLHFRLTPPGQAPHWAVWVYREVTRPHRLVALVSFADAQQNPVRAFFDPYWPMQVLSEVTIEPHAGLGRGSLVTIRWAPYEATDAERDAFGAGMDHLGEGWGATLDRLVTLVERI